MDAPLAAALIPVGQALLSGVLVGGVYGLISIGFSLAFGVMRIVNFAHGDLVMYGMYVGVVASTGFGVDPLYAIPLSFLLMALLGAAQYQLVFKRFVGAATLQQLLAAIGLGLVLQMIAQVVFGADARAAPSMFGGQFVLIGPLFASAAQIVAFIVAVLCTIAVEALLLGTRWGKSVRAVADDIEAAELVGLSAQIHQHHRLRARLRTGRHRRDHHGHVLPHRPLEGTFPHADRDHRDHHRRPGQHPGFVLRRVVLRRHPAAYRDAVEFGAAGRAALRAAADLHRLQADRHVRLQDRIAMDRRARRLGSIAFPLLALVIIAILPALPFVNNYILAAIVRALIFISLGQAWNIVAGIGGLLSLGHGVFLGLGCYVTGLLFNLLGLPPWIGVWVGVLVALAVALVMGGMTLRMRGIFFALATVAVSLAFDQLARHYVDLTGGDNGLALKFEGDSLWAMQSRSPAPFVYAGLVFVVAYYAITRWVLASQLGLEMRAVRDDEIAAAASGVPVFRTKMLGFLVSAAMTALAGGLYMQFYQAIDPESAFGLGQAIQLQLPALIGGLGTAQGRSWAAR